MNEKDAVRIELMLAASVARSLKMPLYEALAVAAADLDWPKHRGAPSAERNRAKRLARRMSTENKARAHRTLAAYYERLAEEEKGKGTTS